MIDAVRAIESAIGLAALCVLVFWLFPAHRIDSFRQQVFALRDEVFDYAADGRISFSHPAYRMLRQSANGFLRYAHQLTFYRIVWTMLVWKIENRGRTLKFTVRWFESLESLDKATRADMLIFHSRLLFVVAKRVVFGSPVLLVLWGLLLLIGYGQVSARDLQRALSKVVDPRLLEEEAVAA